MIVHSTTGGKITFKGFVAIQPDPHGKISSNGTSFDLLTDDYFDTLKFAANSTIKNLKVNLHNVNDVSFDHIILDENIDITDTFNLITVGSL